MMGEQLGLRVRDLRKAHLQNRCNPRVQLLALELEERLVGGVLDQRMLERINGLGRRAAAKDQLGGQQLV